MRSVPGLVSVFVLALDLIRSSHHLRQCLDGHCWRLHFVDGPGLNAYESRDLCLGQELDLLTGADEAAMGSAEEFISGWREVAPPDRSVAFVIGLAFNARRGEWEWLETKESGRASYNTSAQPAYRNWKDGEPGPHHCSAMGLDVEWLAVPCERRFGLVLCHSIDSDANDDPNKGLLSNVSDDETATDNFAARGYDGQSEDVLERVCRIVNGFTVLVIIVLTCVIIYLIREVKATMVIVGDLERELRRKFRPSELTDLFDESEGENSYEE